MRFIASLLAVLLLVSGCATHRPTPTESEISKKRAEAEALELELDALIHTLDRVDETYAKAPSFFPLDAQERELDYRISIIRKAKADLKVEFERVHERYHEPY